MADSETGTRLFEALNDWLEVRKYRPFLAYVDFGLPMQESRKTEFPYAAYMSYQKMGRGTTQQQNMRRRIFCCCVVPRPIF